MDPNNPTYAVSAISGLLAPSGGEWTATLPIPADTRPGQYVLLADCEMRRADHGDRWIMIALDIEVLSKAWRVPPPPTYIFPGRVGPSEGRDSMAEGQDGV